MKSARVQIATVGGTADQVEQAFCEALQYDPIDQLLVRWAEEDEIGCAHPGGPCLSGAGSIRAAFEVLLVQNTVKTQLQHVYKTHALASAVYHLTVQGDVQTPDGLGSVWISATNAYHKTPQDWHMGTHQASPGVMQTMVTSVEMPLVLH